MRLVREAMSNIATTYYESSKGLWVSWDRVLVELERHGCSNLAQECQQALKPKNNLYSASKLLLWLGY